MNVELAVPVLLKAGLFLVFLAISSYLAREYLRELSTRSPITPFRVSILAILFAATVWIVGSIDLGAVSFLTCLLISVFIVYPAYVRDSQINESAEASIHLWPLLIVLVVLIAGLSIFAAPSMVPGLSGSVGIVISYVVIGFFSTIFGHSVMPHLVDETVLPDENEGDEEESPDEGEDDEEESPDEGEDDEEEG